MNYSKIIKWITITLLIIVIVVVAYGSYLQSKMHNHHFWDDTYISLTYVQNFAEGEGLVFNPGEKVEGYTNFLWIIFLTPVYIFCKMFGLEFTFAVIVSCTMFTLINLLLIYLISIKVFSKNRLFAILPLILYAADTTTTFYGMIGMENPFQLTFLLLTLYLFLNGKRCAHYLIGILLAFAMMTRPDSAIFVFVFYLIIIYRLIRKKIHYSPDYYDFKRKYIFSFLLMTLVFGLYFIWRYNYYGLLLPNTFYAKVTGGWEAMMETGLGYLWWFIWSREFIPLISLLSFIWIKEDWIKITGLYLLLHSAYILYIGGDFYPGGRFLVVMLPFIYILLTKIIYEIVILISKYIRMFSFNTISIFVTILAIIFSIFIHLSNSLKYGPVYNQITRFSEFVRLGIKFTKYIGSMSKKGESIYVGAIGNYGYFTDLNVIDYLGLINTDVSLEKVKIFKKMLPGHRKEAGVQYGISKNPTYNTPFNFNHDFRQNGYYLHPGLDDLPSYPYVWVKDYLKREDLIEDSVITFDQIDSWIKTGNAFVNNPKTGTEKNQGTVFGQDGKFINSYAPDKGDLLVGTLTSPPVKLEGDIMLLDIGGGKYKETTYVALYVDGMEVARSSGTNTEYLTRRSWNIRRYKGKNGIIKIVDNAKGSWGHILVDNIRQYHDYNCKYTCFWNERNIYNR